MLCLIVAIADGDTLTARCDVQGNQKTFVVRLSQIDAPEKRQPWGDRSRQHLAVLCFKRSAVIREEGHDRYRRMVARVECDGTDANAAQVLAGMAWVFDRHVTDHRLYELQDEAQGAKRGLWADAAPVPPWNWRKADKAGHPRTGPP